MDEMATGGRDGQPQAKRTLKISGGLTISQAGESREKLLAALTGTDELEVDLSALTEVDLSGLQLLCAAHRSAMQLGKRFRLLGDNEVLAKVVADAGFQRHVGCDMDITNSCIWVEERTDG